MLTQRLRRQQSSQHGPEGVTNQQDILPPPSQPPPSQPPPPRPAQYPHIQRRIRKEFDGYQHKRLQMRFDSTISTCDVCDRCGCGDHRSDHRSDHRNDQNRQPNRIATIRVDSNYPFSPPSVVWVLSERNDTYRRILSMYSESAQRYRGDPMMSFLFCAYVGYRLSDIEGIDVADFCLCCTSLTCKENWAPFRNIHSVAREAMVVPAIEQLSKVCMKKTLLYSLPPDILRRLEEMVVNVDGEW